MQPVGASAGNIVNSQLRIKLMHGDIFLRFGTERESGSVLEKQTGEATVFIWSALMLQVKQVTSKGKQFDNGSRRAMKEEKYNRNSV